MANFFMVRKWTRYFNMPKDLSILLRETIERELPNLRALTDLKAPKPGSWSRKEELGHLIDSATNNHIRFVLATVDGEYRGSGYTQDNWVEAHGYRDLVWSDLIDLWYSYNALVAHLVERIPEEHMKNQCSIGTGQVTLRFLIEDYVLHMQHHLDHILARDPLTAYPAVV
jgi:hypothetical protein